MGDESLSKLCPQCGASAPDDALGGLCPKCLLVQAAAGSGADGLTAAARLPPSLEAVRAAFPQLEVLELIGQGGMAVVFKARQPKLNRLVALKILPERLAAEPAFAERFAREGQMLARLNHPNIVAVHDFGQSGGFYYLLMEYVDGVNLRQALRAGGFTPGQALSIVPKICDALQYAHDEGVLHRDIKPENILMDAKGRVKIADFGIAKFVKEAAAANRLTGAALGTPHYMAPEQIERPSMVDHRADIYSLGVVFYELLTGELPLGRFAPPSEKSTVDARVDKVVLKSLEKQRELRQQSAREVKTQVETITRSPPPAKPMRAGAPHSESPLLGTMLLCSPTALLIWMMLIAGPVFGVDLDADQQMWASLIGLPACAAAGALMVWLAGSFCRRREGMKSDAPPRWSWRAVVAVLLLACSMLLMGGGLAVLALLRHEWGHWHPAPAELMFTLVFSGGGVLASGLATLAGWLARREIGQASNLMRGWRGASLAAWYWPGVAAGVLMLLAATWAHHRRLEAYLLLAVVALVVLAAFAVKAAVQRSLTISAARTVNPWPRRIFWLIVALFVVLPLLLIVSLLAPRFAGRTPSPQPSEPHAYAVFDNVMAVEDLLTFDMSGIVGPPQAAVRMCYLGQPLDASRVASVPKPASGVVLGPAAELREGSGQCTWQLGLRESGPSNLSSYVVLVLPDADTARKAAEQVQLLATEGHQHFSRSSKLTLFTLDAAPQGPVAAWLEFPSGPRGTAVVVNRRPDLEALRAKRPVVDGNVVIPYGCVAEFDVLLRNGDVERPVPQLSFFVIHDDPQRRQEPWSFPVIWSLSPNERAHGPTVGRVQVAAGVPESIVVSHQLPGTEFVAWRLSPGYLTDEALMERLQHLPLDRWLEPIGPVAPGESCLSRLFYGEPRLPLQRAGDEQSLALMLRISVHRLPGDWKNPRPGIHVQAATPWREYLGLPPELQARPIADAAGVAPSNSQETVSSASEGISITEEGADLRERVPSFSAPAREGPVTTMQDESGPGAESRASGAFMTTNWTRVLAARGESPAAKEALRELCAAYYAPVDAYIRQWRRGGDDARDLTHDFFARLLAGHALSQLDRARGRFRSYLLGAVKHFLSDVHDRQRAAKRGAGAAPISLDSASTAGGGSDDSARGWERTGATGFPPDAFFDRQWALKLLERVLDALAGEYEQAGKTPEFQVLKPFLTAAAAALSPSDAAARLGVSAGAAKVAIHRLRKRFRRLVRVEIASTVADADDVSSEIDYLVHALSQAAAYPGRLPDSH